MFPVKKSHNLDSYEHALIIAPVGKVLGIEED
jgi:hypothetical protein